MSNDTPRIFPQSADAVVATLTELFRHQGNRSACEVLENAKARIEETGYDNLDGGIYYFTLFLDIPLKVFASIEPNVSRIERIIAGKLLTVLRTTGDTVLRQVTIIPILEQPRRSVEPKVAPVDVERLWLPGMLRLFLSHIAAHKVPVSKLKGELQKLGVSSFVAHEAIEPTLEWQSEIELALRSMHSFVALLTPDFHMSKWTDQEVGFALGKGVLVIPVRLGLDPYGFIGKLQGTPGSLETPAALASSIVDLLLKHKTTASTMRESLVVALEKSPSFAASKLIASKIEAADYFTAEQLKRLETTCKDNSQVKESFGVAARINKIIQRCKRPVPDDVPF